MIVQVDYHDFCFTFPPKEEPLWSQKVERWYQLDAYAFGLTQAYAMAPSDPPQFVVLASAEASNRTDFLFAKSGGASPSKFVHTLPNIRSSSLCQVMGWSGPLLCIQKDPGTLVTALIEAADLLDTERSSIWVLGVRFDSTVGNYHAYRFTLRRSGSEVAHRPLDLAGIRDADFWIWLEESSKGSSFILSGHELREVLR